MKKLNSVLFALLVLCTKTANADTCRLVDETSEGSTYAEFVPTPSDDTDVIANYSATIAPEVATIAFKKKEGIVSVSFDGRSESQFNGKGANYQFVTPDQIPISNPKLWWLNGTHTATVGHEKFSISCQP
jgi:hypothetical protein